MFLMFLSEMEQIVTFLLVLVALIYYLNLTTF